MVQDKWSVMRGGVIEMQFAAALTAAQKRGEAAMSRAVVASSAAKRCAIFCGSGISIESGLGAFEAPVAGLKGLGGATCCSALLGGTPIGWSLTPQAVWKGFVQGFHRPIAAAAPNAGHYALAELQEHLGVDRAPMITTSVDGLLQVAGAAAVTELHGSARRFRGPCGHEVESARQQLVAEHLGEQPLPEAQPQCASCGGPVRPCMALMGESLPPDAVRAAKAAVGSLGKGDVRRAASNAGRPEA